MKKYILLALIIFSFYLVSGADWQAHPLDCLDEYNTVSCSVGELQCGIDPSDFPYCYNNSALNPPGSDDTSNAGDTYQSGLPAGTIVDCQGTDAAEPYCDNSGNFWCNRNATCYGVGRKSTCKANKWSNDTAQTECSTCRDDGNDHFYCDGSYTDADGCEIRVGTSCGSGTGTIDSSETCYDANNGNCTSVTNYDCDDDDGDSNLATCNGANGCEVSEGGSCTVGPLTGTYSGCTCIVSQKDFRTGDFIEYNTNASQGGMLWFKDHSETSILVNITNVKNDSWIINASGCIQFMDKTWQCTATAAGSSFNATYDAFVTANMSNKSTHWGEFSSHNETQMNNSGGVLNILLSWLKSKFYEKLDIDNNLSLHYLKAEVDNNLSNYLQLTDQRFNETDILISINTTDNIKSLDFYNKAEADANDSLHYLKVDVDNNLSLHYIKVDADNNLSNYLLISGANASIDARTGSNGSTEWIKPEHIFDVDDADIETDLNTYVDIAGDTMTGDLQMLDNVVNGSGGFRTIGPSYFNYTLITDGSGSEVSFYAEEMPIFFSTSSYGGGTTAGGFYDGTFQCWAADNEDQSTYGSSAFTCATEGGDFITMLDAGNGLGLIVDVSTDDDKSGAYFTEGTYEVWLADAHAQSGSDAAGVFTDSSATVKLIFEGKAIDSIGDLKFTLGTGYAEIYQGADSHGIRVYGFDNVNDKYASLFISSGGTTRLTSSTGMNLDIIAANDLILRTGDDIFMDLGGGTSASQVRVRNSSGADKIIMDALGYLEVVSSNVTGNTYANTIYNSLGELIIDTEARTLTAQDGDDVIDWSSLYLYDSSDIQSIDWGSRLLQDSNDGSTLLDWSTAGLIDITGDMTASGTCDCGTVVAQDGFTGSWTNAESNTVTVTDGIITDVS